METVRQEDIRVNLPARDGTTPQRFGIALAINLVLENRFAPVALMLAVKTAPRYSALTLRVMT